ncbi:MAG TPA: phytanoyl-CoA dioxygenase family protein [Chthonomonadaceae bacterium]|nr:phytanoyl-CoA dioxygenase family protein [Chthonomonadaceae bacterium]
MTAVSPAAPTVRVEDLEVFADDLDVQRAAAIYKEHGCLVVRGLMKPYIPELARDIEATAQQSIALLDQAQKVTEGWTTPDGTLFLPAPPGFQRDKQIMVLRISYYTSAAFFRSAFDMKTVDLVEAILGPNIELFINGQCLYKEPVGGHPKHLHQDAAYFEHRYEGPVGVLSYVVDTDLTNGALHVVPGSHKMGVLKHVDTFSHLGLSADEWPWERALPIVGKAGDSIFFHVKTIHGSQENHSDKPRPVFIHRYRRADDYVTIGGTTTANRAENEKRAEEAKKENQRGLMVRGFRPYEPPPQS